MDDLPDEKYPGVVLDINPYGMRIRMLELIPVGCSVSIQMMKDDDYEVPLSTPVVAQVVRNEEVQEFVDHGVFIRPIGTRRVESKPVTIEPKVAPSPRKPRVQLFDMTVGEYRRQPPGENK